MMVGYWSSARTYAAKAESAWNEEEQSTTTKHGHGRDERRMLTARCLPQGMARWPSVRQALRRVTWRCSQRTGKIEEDVTYAITDVPHSQVGAARLEQYWRGHWGIENRIHDIRDVVWGEDANHGAQGATAQALAAVRNGLLSRLRLVPIRSAIAASLRFFASDPFAALSPFPRFLADFANALHGEPSRSPAEQTK